LKAKYYFLTAAVMCLVFVLALCSVAAPAVVENFETSAESVYIPVPDEQDTASSDAQRKTIPVILEGIADGRDASFLMSDGDEYIRIQGLYIPELYLNQETIEISVGIDNILDSKYKMTVALVDENGNEVTEQTGCKYDAYNEVLVFSLNVKNVYEIDPEIYYEIKLSYSGDYEMVSLVSDSYVCFRNEIVILNRKIVDFNNATVSFTILNLDPEKQYVVCFYDNAVEEYVEGDLVSKNSNVYVYKAKNHENAIIDYGNFISIEYGLFEVDGEFLYSIDYGCFDVEKNPYGEGYEYDDYIDGVDYDFRIGIDAEVFEPYLMRKESGEYYSSADYKNFEIYLIDSVTSKVVAKLYDSEYIEEDKEYACSLKITEPLVDERVYFLVVDDGETIRLGEIVATSLPSFAFCGFSTVNGDTYHSDSIPCDDNVSVMIVSPANMPTPSKLSAEFVDPDTGDVIYSIVKSSVLKDGNIYRFKMKINSSYSPEDFEYLDLLLFYDSKLIYKKDDVSVDMFFGGDHEEYAYFDGWWQDSFGSTEKTYLSYSVYSDGYDFSDIDFVLCDLDTEEEYVAEYTVIYSDGYDYSKLLLEFDFGCDLYEEKEFDFYTRYKGEDIYFDYASVYYDYDGGVKVIETVVNNDGYTYIYALGLNDGDEYTLFSQDIDGNEAKVPLKKVIGKPALRTETENFGFFTTDNYRGNYQVLEVNGEYECLLNLYDYGLDYVAPEAFYSKYFSQDHRFAILCMPETLYTHYRVASSVKELEDTSYSKIKGEVLYTLPDEVGEHVINGQFKDKSGKESVVMRTYVTIGKPELVWNETPTKIYYAENEDGTEFIIDFDFTTNFEGYGYVIFYGNGNDYLDEAFFTIHNGRNASEVDFNTADFSVDDITKIRLYVDAEFEGESDSFYFEETYDVDFEFKERYTKYQLSDGFILFDNAEACVVGVKTTLTDVIIPSSIDGVPVKSIGDFQVINPYDCPNIRTLQIPASVTEISPYAFENITGLPLNLTLKVRDGSYAQEYAERYSEEYGFDYETVLYIVGDVTNDDSVDINDAIYVLQYSMFSEDYPLDYAGSVDFNGDGSVDLNDAILLLQHSMFPDDYPIE